MANILGQVGERRHRVFTLAAEGGTRASIGAQLCIGEATVYRILASVIPAS